MAKMYEFRKIRSCPIFTQQVGTDGQKNFLFINLRCKGNNKSSIGM